MMKRTMIAALLLASACQIQTGAAVSSGGGISYAFVTPYGQKVNPVNANEFEVMLNAGATYDGYWCGASEYARRRLGAAWSDRVYVASTISPSVTTDRASAVRFTLDPQALGIEPIELNFRSGFKVGDSMSITQANTRCQVYRPFPFD